VQEYPEHEKDPDQRQGRERRVLAGQVIRDRAERGGFWQGR